MTIKQMLAAELGCSEALVEKALNRILAQIYMKGK